MTNDPGGVQTALSVQADALAALQPGKTRRRLAQMVWLASLRAVGRPVPLQVGRAWRMPPGRDRWLTRLHPCRDARADAPHTLMAKSGQLTRIISNSRPMSPSGALSRRQHGRNALLGPERVVSSEVVRVERV